VKLLRYGNRGHERPGLVDREGRIRDLGEVVADLSPESLAEGVIERIRALDPASLPEVPAGVRVGPCISRVGHFIAVGLNYADHAAESNMPAPVEPILFSKAPSSLSGPDDDVVVPRGSSKVDWEVELAIVIGRRADGVDEAGALDHVAGFAVCNDLSERHWQLEGTGQWLKGKSAAGFGPLGPWLVTPDEIADVQSLDMFLDLNGERVQTGSTRTMIFSATYLVAYCSRFMVLEPGDVITTGTPPGVGMARKPPRFLQAGDRLQLGIDGLGEQRQNVVAHSASRAAGDARAERSGEVAQPGG
jgi:2-keto-4-pentenoate hydratase/2-oxohepta-3-ene-1,7-dioic acid hydratase in catechol pathway